MRYLVDKLGEVLVALQKGSFLQARSPYRQMGLRGLTCRVTGYLPRVISP